MKINQQKKIEEANSRQQVNRLIPKSKKKLLVENERLKKLAAALSSDKQNLNG